MKTVALPDWPIGESIAESLDFIIEYDQWDDWVPDVVYLRDVAEDQRGFLEEVEVIRTSGSISFDHVLGLEVFSDNKLKFRTATMPLVQRVLISAVMASRADPVQRKLLADRLHGLEYRPSSQRVVPEWTADLFGMPYRSAAGAASTGGNVEPRSPVTHSSKPPLFSALNDGLYEALTATGEWLLNDHREVRSVAWRDIQSYYSNIRRSRLWATLTECGFHSDTSRFLEEVTQACGATTNTGIFPIDDAWGFLANVYLLPVDRALSGSGRQFQRCADEYFLMAGDKDDRAAAERLLAAELAKLQLTLNPKKQADIEIDMRTFGREEEKKFTLAVEEFLLTVSIRMSEPPDVAESQSVVTVSTWDRMLKDVLSVEPGHGPHNRTMTMLRAMHFARERDVLTLPEVTSGIGERARRYRQALAEATWLPGLLRQRLEQAVASQRTWPCHWLLLLLSDLGARGAEAFDIVARLASAPGTEPVLCAQAMLALATTLDQTKATPLLNGIALTGVELADRFNIVALFTAQKRWGGAWLSRVNASNYARLTRHLVTRRGGQ